MNKTHESDNIKRRRIIITFTTFNNYNCYRRYSNSTTSSLQNFKKV